MSNTNTEVLTTAYEKLQGALTQSNTVLPKLEEAIETGDLQNYAKASDLEEKVNKDEAENENIVQQYALHRNEVRGLNLEKVGVMLEKGASGAWDANRIESGYVWFDEKYHKYGMMYVGYADSSGQPYSPKIGIAWSDDLITWTKDANNPVFGGTGVEGDPDKIGTTGCTLYIENGTYYLFYIALDKDGYEQGTKTMCLATSTDLYNWTRYSGNPLISPTGDGWRKTAIWKANIVKHNGVYYNFFNASGSVHTEERIGYATSTDLYNWTVDDANSPILTVGVAGTWESDWVGDPFVYKIGNVWYMAYYGKGAGVAGDGVAFTTDAEFPLGWRKYSGNPILSKGNTGDYDDKYAHKPCIYMQGGVHYHYYTFVDVNDNRGVGLAIEKGVSDKLLPKQTISKNIMLNCRETTRNVSTTLASVTESTVMFDTNNRKNIKMRIYVRGKVDDTANTMTVYDGILNNEALLTIYSTDWVNVASPWKAVTSDSGVVNTNLKAYISAGAGQIGSVAYEFKWEE